jgi:hypothetical protein
MGNEKDSGDSQPMYIEPSIFNKAFSLVGAFVAVSALAVMITFAIVVVTEWHHFVGSIFGLAWAIVARLFQWSVRRGIVLNLSSPHLTTEKRRILGEQLAMFRIVRWFVLAEFLASVILLLVEIFTR